MFRLDERYQLGYYLRKLLDGEITDQQVDRISSTAMAVWIDCRPPLVEFSRAFTNSNLKRIVRVTDPGLDTIDTRGVPRTTSEVPLEILESSARPEFLL